jgi:UDP-glucose 4-epimerase
MKYFVTGGAGFIGSNLVDRLLADGHEIVVYDNLSTGLQEFLANAFQHKSFMFIKGDTLDLPELTKAMQTCEFVFHLAANADVRFGLDHPEKDLKQNTIATFNVLEAMRVNKINKIAFSSTGSIYGEAKIIPTPENAPFPVQTWLYGASKLACEGLIEAYCKGFGFQSWIFRFVSILGERYTHGHVLDFYKKLLENPSELPVLGNGSQKKSYLYIHDCLDAMLFSIDKFNDDVNILNLGTNEYCQVNESIGWITTYLGLKPELIYSGGDRGWVGDNPFIFLDTNKINSAGWKPKLGIKDAVIRTLEFLQVNRWVLNQRRSI